MKTEIFSVVIMFFLMQGIADFGELEKTETKIAQWSFGISIGFFVIGILTFV